MPDEQRLNFTTLYNPMKLRDVQARYPYIQWKEYITNLLPRGLQIDDNEQIVVSAPAYFEHLGKLLERTPKRTIANYMMWRVVLTMWTDLNAECVDITSHSLSTTVGDVYLRSHFKEETKASVVQMVTGILEQLEFIIENVSWIDNVTRAAAKEKVNAMTMHIGYKDYLIDIIKLEVHYDGLDINPENYLESLLRINILDTEYQFNNLRKLFEKTKWTAKGHASPTFVNAYYVTYENSLGYF